MNAETLTRCSAWWLAPYLLLASCQSDPSPDAVASARPTATAAAAVPTTGVAGLHDAFRADAPAIVGRRVRVRAVALLDASRSDVAMEGAPGAGGASNARLLVLADSLEDGAPGTSCRLAASAPRIAEGEDVVVEGLVVAMMGEPHLDRCVVVTR